MIETSVMMFSKTIVENRIDAEFYKKEYLENERLILKHNWMFLEQLADRITDGSHITPDYKEEGVPFLMVRNIENFEIDFENVSFIEQELDKELEHCKPAEGDILMSKVGTLGRIAIVPPNKNFNIFVSLAVLKGIKSINKYFLATFLLTKIAYLQFSRYVKGISQPDFHIEDIKKIKVPIPEEKFQKEIEQLIKISDKSREEATKLYEEAEILLLKELNMDIGYKKHDKTFMVNLWNIKQSNRFDADYFQPKYKGIIKKIENYANGYELLNTATTINDKVVDPEKQKIYKYIELSNIGRGGNIENLTDELGYNLPDRARREVMKDDVIISSVEGSLSSCALITQEADNLLCSTGFFNLTSQKINPETLFMLFKSAPLQYLLKRGCSGTILSGINREELEKIPIPIIKNVIQEEIRLKIRNYYKLRNKADSIIEEAKRKIELYVISY